MDRDAFKRYLRTNKFAGNKPYSESTADERVRCCRTIEEDLSINLDTVVDPNERVNLIEKVKVTYMNRSHPNTFIHSLEAYFDFMDSRSTTKSYICDPRGTIQISKQFYKFKNDPLPDKYREILPDLESSYECIMGFGRNLLGHIDSLDERIDRIPVILSPEKKKKTYTADDKWLSKKIAEYSRKCQGNVSEQVILKFLQNKTFTDNILGEFCRGNREFGPYIVLYYNVIGGETDQKRIANFANVLAHEYMHYMEYVYCSPKGVKDYSNEFLSEAMADFFGLLYSIRYPNAESLNVTHARYNDWKKNFYTCWPYAEALYFYSIDSIKMDYSDIYTDYENHGSVEKLKKVFFECHDAKKAYKTLKVR